ncbi:MAG: hypothetical protein HC879_18650, partial [Leptolyngbyaceae cyanobacterium SL_5_9]|nr:hypothetical protein [Leptolyngbyaceae cyanobacterium SL_5_9]
MAPKNSGDSISLLLVSLLITGGIIGILWFWLAPRLISQLPPNESVYSSPASLSSEALADRFSMGERHLIQTSETLAKQEGIAAFAAADYPQSVRWFEESLLINPNDPETLIYLNNARLRAEQRQTVAIATSIPIGKALNVAQEILRGVAQAQDEINRSGGING